MSTATVTINSKTILHTNKSDEITRKIHIKNKKKRYDRVLVLGGGGVKGSFQVGVIKSLVEQGARWDLIVGVSVGAITGSFLAMYNKEEIEEGVKQLESFWRNKITNETIYKPTGPGFWKYAIAFFTKYVNSTEPLRKLINENWDFTKLKKSNVDFILGTTSLITGTYKNIDKYHDGMTEWIMASSAYPILFPAIKIGNDEYIDGGLRNNNPINDCLQFDVGHIDVILCEPYGDHAKTLKRNKSIIDIIIRTTEILSDAVFLNDLKEISYHNKMSIDVYSPLKYLTSEALDFDKEIINEMLDVGCKAYRKVSVKHRDSIAATNNKMHISSDTNRTEFAREAVITDSLGISGDVTDTKITIIK